MNYRSALLGLLYACTSASGEPPLERQGYEINACAEDHYAPALGNLSPGQPVDYLELQDQSGGMQSIGERCLGATDAATCEDAYANLFNNAAAGWALRPDGGFPAPTEFMIYTRGDEVGTVGIREIGSFLAPVDTVADAILLAQIASLGSPQCEENNIRETEEGFEVITQTSQSCGGRRSESRVAVDRGGEYRTLETATLDAGGEGPDCP